jgi:pyruvate,water dikinase
MALLRPEEVSADEAAEIARRLHGVDDPAEFFVQRLSEGIGKIAASVYPHPAVVRTSDFKTNEYAKLLGGSSLERVEENPMIGFRGASRYASDEYRPAFELECRALRTVREDMGLDNVVPMIPFCRTLDEADAVLAIMEGCGLVRGRNGLEIYVMCEVPSNVVLARDFAARFDGFSIGSNDLTQLTLGVDRDNAALSGVFDESNPAVKRLIEDVIRSAHGEGRKVGFCGQAPSNDPEYAAFLVGAGIDSVSVDPDSVIAVTRIVSEAAGCGSTGTS